jgi:hypothetical protein
VMLHCAVNFSVTGGRAFFLAFTHFSGSWVSAVCCGFDGASRG